jgi:hypothetical protein
MIHKSTNKRFRCFQYGIKWLAKTEAEIEANLKRQAKRYNKDYPGQMLHGDTKRLPLLIWLTVANKKFLPFFFIFCFGSGAAMTTVDHADMRGLDTACLVYVVELPLTKHRSSALPA